MSRSHVLRSLSLLALVVALLSGGCFPTAAGPRLRHFASVAPEAGEPIPDVPVASREGALLALPELLDGRPLVLQVGSHSCPVYRYRRHSMRSVWERFAGEVRFVLLYSREAHPVGSPSPYAEGEEWDPWINRLTGVRVEEPEDLAARSARAADSVGRLGLPLELVVDRMDDAAWRSLGAASSPAFVFDADGRLALRQVWIEPRAITETLERLLATGR